MTLLNEIGWLKLNFMAFSIGAMTFKLVLADAGASKEHHE
jgi:hypothetical protein